MSGCVEAIFVGSVTAGPLGPVESVHVVPGQGVEGDRYWQADSLPARKRGPDREITLIEAEAIEALRRDHGIDLDPSESRRNVLTRGVALNPLVGQAFRVGGVRLKGLRLCDPCAHLEKLTRPGVLAGLAQRGGLRAQVLDEGWVKVGDAVEVGEA